MKHWLESPRIYVENARGGEPAYHITTENVVAALADVCPPETITCQNVDERDVDAFRQADIFIASRLDTTLINEGRNLKLIQWTSAGVENTHRSTGSYRLFY
ncbi:MULTISPECIES: hypothetical protein [unclassified Neorhizobium]|uniref:hypothetical protein n=1 Tax=unclassified Neorhizobium TaxID=2629175 RepID=UPI001FF51D1E|nr:MULTISPECIES: hypothetical protein [unclassified Neorhizobium]MCJ9670053.1 hypothetical protein [Neorhizobium sp. SHOUNA12B]MCJ9746038.1 hypothetical protein [Neorhizobium sp. SHOUNA12A]